MCVLKYVGDVFLVGWYKGVGVVVELDFVFLGDMFFGVLFEFID